VKGEGGERLTVTMGQLIINRMKRRMVLPFEQQAMIYTYIRYTSSVARIEGGNILQHKISLKTKLKLESCYSK